MRGALLAFGGARRANIALMVEVLAAGLAGANWSLDAPSLHFRQPLARAPASWSSRLPPAYWRRIFAVASALQLERLANLGVHIPGRRAAAAHVELPDALVAEIERSIEP